MRNRQLVVIHSKLKWNNFFLGHGHLGHRKIRACKILQNGRWVHLHRVDTPNCQNVWKPKNWQEKKLTMPKGSLTNYRSINEVANSIRFGAMRLSICLQNPFITWKLAAKWLWIGLENAVMSSFSFTRVNPPLYNGSTCECNFECRSFPCKLEFCKQIVCEI